MGYRLGRLAAKRPVGLADLHHYLHDPLPAGPPAVEAPSIDAWGMLGNDEYGDCTIAGVVHLRMADAAEQSQSETWPSADEVVRTYFTLSGGQDAGLNEADVLHTWYRAGLFGDKISGYAPVNHRSFDELRSVVAAFGGSYLGITVPAPAQEQFANGQPWDLTGTSEDRDIEGGHCVPAVGYDSQYVYVVTWGQLQKATWRWVHANLEEAWAVLTSEDARVNLSALQQDLRLLAG